MALSSLNPLYGEYMPYGRAISAGPYNQGPLREGATLTNPFSNVSLPINASTYMPATTNLSMSSNFDPHINPATGVWDDNYYASKYKSPQQIVNETIDNIKSLIDQQVSMTKPFTPQNPFTFDEELAKKSATAEYEPYYSELLQDYLGNIGVKRETIQDESKLLNELRTTPLGTAGKATREYNRAIGQAEEGFAGSGMFFSGIKKRALGQTEVEREYGLTTQATEIQQKQRDIERQQKAAIEAQILKRREEEMKKYALTNQQTYLRQTTGGTQGYGLEDYLRY